ncbi:MAG: DUF932 domain-containing protein [Verrucomicrobiota bacterium]
MTTTSIPRFARAASNGAISYTSRQGAIATDHLRQLAPSIFAEDAHGSRSDRYAHIPTSAVLERLMSEGFRPYAVMQGGSRDAAKRAFTKHVIRLRHDSQELQVGGTHNEIVLLNSHDGSSSYRLMAGVFRLVCGNGMIVAQSMIEDIRISHKGDVAGLVLDGCIEIMERLPEVSESIREMGSINLSEAEQTAFARAALVARYDGEAAPIRVEQVLAPRRREDSASDLWQVLNRTQENIIRGGVTYVQSDGEGRPVARRRTREIKGVDQNTTVNRALWTLAEEMKAIKAAG